MNTKMQMRTMKANKKKWIIKATISLNSFVRRYLP